MQSHGKMSLVLFLLICIFGVQNSFGGQSYPNDGASYWKQLVINNLKPKNQLVVNAGEDQSTMPGRIVKLSCLGSSDPDSITLEWKIDIKPVYSDPLIFDSDSCFPSFIADQPGEYEINLVASDGFNNTQSDTVTIIASYDDYPNALSMLETRGFDDLGDNLTDYFIRLGAVWPPTKIYAPPLKNNLLDPIGFHVLVLDNEISNNSLAIKLNESYIITIDNNQCKELGQDLSKISENDLVILSSLKFPTPGEGLASYCDGSVMQQLLSIGASSDINYVGYMEQGSDYSRQPYTLIGYNGIGEGKGFEVWGYKHLNSDANQFGYLLKAPNQTFRFLYPYIPFETRKITDNNDGFIKQSIRIGFDDYPVPGDPIPIEEGGFYVLTMSRDVNPPQVISRNFYHTNTAVNHDTDLEQLKTMANDLAEFVQTKGGLDILIISSVGSPFKMNLFDYELSSDFRNTASKLQNTITWMGGTPGIFSALGPDGKYSLVGIGPCKGYNKPFRFPTPDCPVESIEVSNIDNNDSTTISYTDFPANMVGLFHKNSRGWYTPLFANGGGTEIGILAEIINVILQDPLSWNNPGSWRGTNDNYYMIAYEIISEELLYGIPGVLNDRDLRALYHKQGSSIDWHTLYDTIKVELSYTDLLGKLKNKDDVRQKYFIEKSFNEVKSNLLEEIDARNRVYSWFFDDAFCLNNLLKDINGQQGAKLNEIYNKISNSFIQEDHKDIEITMKVLKYTGETVKFISEIVALFGGPPLSFVDEESKAAPAVGLLGSLIGFSSEFIESFGQTTNPTGELRDTVGAVWNNFSKRFFTLEVILQNIFAIIVEDWNKLETVDQKHLEWYDPETQADVVNNYLVMGFEKYFYQELLPVVYEIEYMDHVPYTTPHDFWLFGDFGRKVPHQKVDYSFLRIPELGTGGCGQLSSIFTFWENTYKDPCDSGKRGFMDQEDFECLFRKIDHVSNSMDCTPQHGKGFNRNEFFTRWPFKYWHPCNWDSRNGGRCP